MKPEYWDKAKRSLARRDPVGVETLIRAVDTLRAVQLGRPAGADPRAAAEVEPLRQAYAAAGYGHGHRVGLLLENRPAFLLHWFALNALGASVVGVSTDDIGT